MTDSPGKKENALLWNNRFRTWSIPSVKEARDNAAKMIDDAAKECALREQSAKASISQAARDVSLSLREEINRQLAAILSSEVRSSFDKDLVKKTVLSLIEASLKDMDIEISADDAASIVKGLSGELATKLKDGLELKVGNGASGIRLVSKDGSGYVDFSSSSVSEILMPYLSQSIKEQIFSE